MKRLNFLLMFFLVSILFIFTETGNAQTAVKIVLGNPSGAVSDVNTPENYLVVHRGFILSYNKERGAANWVTWHLSASDVGTADRTNAFAPDTSLPREWWIYPKDLSLKGYDRGHLCASEDRSDTEDNNRETFLMSNMQPQTARLNRGAWKSLESYLQKLVTKSNVEAYIYAGCYGDKGRIKDKITIPTNCWKIAVILPEGENDIKRATKKTRVIAADFPNETTNKTGWKNYITTVDDIEEKTGYDFLSTLSEDIQAVIEAKKDNQ